MGVEYKYQDLRIICAESALNDPTAQTMLDNCLV